MNHYVINHSKFLGNHNSNQTNRIGEESLSKLQDVGAQTHNAVTEPSF